MCHSGEISKYLDPNAEELLPDKIIENVVFRRVAHTATGPASVEAADVDEIEIQAVKIVSQSLSTTLAPMSGRQSDLDKCKRREGAAML